MYAKYKARWIDQQAIHEFDDMNTRKIPRAKSMESSKIWSRLNNDGLTPLTLAADLGRTSMLSWLLHERKIIQWSYGDVTCVLHPLDQLDLGFHTKASQYQFKFIYIYIY